MRVDGELRVRRGSRFDSRRSSVGRPGGRLAGVHRCEPGRRLRRPAGFRDSPARGGRLFRGRRRRVGLLRLACLVVVFGARLRTGDLCHRRRHGRGLLVLEAEIVRRVIVVAARNLDGANRRGTQRRRRQGASLALHALRRPQRVVEVVLRDMQRNAGRRRDLPDEQVARVVVELALLLRQRPDARQRVQALEHLDGAEQSAAVHAVGVLAVPDLPVELRLLAVGRELIEDLFDSRHVGHLAQADAHHLFPRHHHRRAVLLARERDDLPVAASDLLGLHAGDAADALVRIHDAIADVQAAVSDRDLLRWFGGHSESFATRAQCALQEVQH